MARLAVDPIGPARDRVRAQGGRWTPQRQALVELLMGTPGHVTSAELVDRARAADPTATPSTVYRTLDALEELGLVRHSHGADGREEYHVMPASAHAHLVCSTCGRTWEIEEGEARELTGRLSMRHGFAVDLEHLSIEGRCADCAREAGAG
jgi:Fur family ferric uptake transcriptional regulator